MSFTGRNHPQQTARRPLVPALFPDLAPSGDTDDIDDRGTPWDLYRSLTDPLGGCDLDVAASAYNAKCKRFYTLAEDGLSQRWNGRVWCNPPYSNIEPWIRKAWDEWERTHCRSIVMLLPANRTEQGWWQRLVEPHRDYRDGFLHTQFLAFHAGGDHPVKPNERPPFGCVLLTWSAPLPPDPVQEGT